LIDREEGRNRLANAHDIKDKDKENRDEIPEYLQVG
jgi:hypothetical protein